MKYEYDKYNLLQVFLKSHKRISHYKKIAPLLRLPPDPAPTRFGTWIESVRFSCENFEILSKVRKLILSYASAIILLKYFSRSLTHCRLPEGRSLLVSRKLRSY